MRNPVHSKPSDLLPCPFCGSKDAICVDLSLDDPWYVVQCGKLGKVGCGASVGSTISYTVARRHWNDRAPSNIERVGENKEDKDLGSQP